MEKIVLFITSNRLMLMFVVLGSLLLTSVSAYALTSDSGTIIELYASSGGSMAIRLSNGFTNAVAAGECPAAAGWAGISANAPNSLKAAIMAAKVAGSPVSVWTNGCLNTTWFSISSIYID